MFKHWCGSIHCYWSQYLSRTLTSIIKLPCFSLVQMAFFFLGFCWHMLWACRQLLEISDNAYYFPLFFKMNSLMYCHGLWIVTFNINLLLKLGMDPYNNTKHFLNAKSGVGTVSYWWKRRKFKHRTGNQYWWRGIVVEQHLILSGKLNTIVVL